jgi:hypothetical protein
MAGTPPASAQPESQREGYPHDDPRFVALCREHDILGTAMQGLAAVFWRGASAQDDAKDEKPYCYALETRGRWGDEHDVLLDVEYNATDSFSGGRTGGIPLYRRPAPAAGDARALLDHPLLRDVLGYIEDAGPADVWGAAQSWMALRDAASQQQEG